MIINPYVYAGGFDPDAQAFITAAALTNPTQQNAINTLVVSMKGYGIWTKMKAIYPFVGGTATTHKWNLKDPRDLDAAFRLVFNGGWTHSSNGIQGNGVNGYANTFFSSALNMTTNNSTIGVYTRNSATPTGSAYGGVDTSFCGNALSIRFSGDNNSYWAANDNQGKASFNNITPLAGLWTVTIDSTNINNKRIYKNNTLISSGGRAQPVSTSNNIFISARNRSTIDSYDNSEFCFFYIANINLTVAEIGDFYTAIQAYQTNLNRQVI
jgi:hypothetical protein